MAETFKTIGPALFDWAGDDWAHRFRIKDARSGRPMDLTDVDEIWIRLKRRFEDLDDDAIVDARLSTGQIEVTDPENGIAILRVARAVTLGVAPAALCGTGKVHHPGPPDKTKTFWQNTFTVHPTASKAIDP
jgi:hypothetical protein